MFQAKVYFHLVDICKILAQLHAAIFKCHLPVLPVNFYFVTINVVLKNNHLHWPHNKC